MGLKRRAPKVEGVRVLNGKCEEVLKGFPDAYFDSVVTDPPYGLSKEPDIVEVLTKWLAGEDYTHTGGGFMGKSWDSFVPGPCIWREIFRVLKPGGYALVFAGTRTQDLMTIALRMAGFDVRDVIEWLYFSGFPKSMDVGKQFDKQAGVEREVIREHEYRSAFNSSGIHQAFEGVTHSRMIKETAPATDLAKQWDGWGTALKPGHEPIIVVRKPLVGTVADNVEKYGTGGINIDGCRIGEGTGVVRQRKAGSEFGQSSGWNEHENVDSFYDGTKGRFPANVVTVEDDGFWSVYCNVTPQELSKKASKKDRNSDWQGRGIDLPEKTAATHNYTGRDMTNPRNAMGEGERKRVERGEPAQLPQKNNHPTVKPSDLMAWLIRLVTPPGGMTLDPFCGSGTTLVAAKREGFQAVGIDNDTKEGYVALTKARAQV